MIAKEDLAEVLQVAVKNGDFAEIYIEKSSQNRVSMEDGKIERVISGRDEGAGIRVIKGDNTAYGYTTDLTKEGLMELARQVAGGLGEPGREAKAGEKAALSIVFEQRESPVSLPVEQRPDEVSIDQKVALVLEAERAARAKDEKLIRQVSVGYADTIQQVVIANSDGVYVEDERVRSRLVVHVVASDGKVIQTGYESAGGTKGFELFAEEKAADLGRRAAERALLMLKARPAPAGRMAVVISGEAGGTMIHEACGHGLEADLVQKNLSVYAGRKGEKVASELVTVIDDGTIPGKYGSFSFDDEGTIAQRNVLIEKGILRNYMYDRITAQRDGVKPTGNGRRESFRHRPIPRMSTTYLAPGDDSPEEIIRETKEGLFVRRMGGGQVNTTTGDFVFEVLEGYLIKDGKIDEPVRGATLTGNGPEVLQKIDRVGNDLGFTIGTCGKDGQGVPVTDAQPTIRIPDLVVGGILEDEGDHS